MTIDFKKTKERKASLLSVSSKYLETCFDHSGGGISLEGIQPTDRYLIGSIEVLEDHAVALMLRFYLPNEKTERLTMRFGILPKMKPVWTIRMQILH